MLKKLMLINLVLVLAVVLAACAPQAAPSEDKMMDKPTDAAMLDDKKDEGMVDEKNDAGMTEDTEDPAMMELPVWFKASLTDASTGEDFSIAGFQGKVVLVETLAMWCSNCLRQQNEVKKLHDLLGDRSDFVSVGIGIDVNENLADLKSYVDKNGFDWYYTVASIEVAREIASLYGDQFLNPPSTPMLIIDKSGKVHPLPFGIKSADQLNEALQPYFSE